MTYSRDVKRYLQHVSFTSDGLLVVRKSVPFEAGWELIVVRGKDG